MKFPVIPTINLVLKSVYDSSISEEFESYKDLESYCYRENETIYRCAYSTWVNVAERQYIGDEKMFKDYFLENLEDIISEAGFEIVKVVRG